jgi:hypothetical protein
MYKNWQAISNIPDIHFRWAMALLELGSDFGGQIAKQLPAYFSDQKLEGPIPLSAIILKARNEKTDEDFFSEEFIVSNGVAAKFDITLIEFGVDEASAAGADFPLLPPEISLENIRCSINSKMGLRIVWDGKELVMLEYNENIGTVSFAPAELIAVDK